MSRRQTLVYLVETREIASFFIKPLPFFQRPTSNVQRLTSSVYRLAYMLAK
jgi:hypothetical protein